MADESSEGKRYSYKKPKPEPQKRRKPKDDTPRRRVAQKDVPRRETPAEEMRRRGLETKAGKVVRDKDRSREMPKSKPNYGQPWRDGVNVDRTTPGDQALNAGRRKSFEMMAADRQGDKKYADPAAYRGPERIDDRSANPPAVRPSPMIRAGVGPVAQLSSQAAHTYGFTPEAYNELASIPTSLRPPEEEFEKTAAGAYFPRGEDRIFLNSYTSGRTDPGILAHEQAHANWFRQDLDSPKVTPGYGGAFDRWRGEQVDFEDGSTGWETPNAATAANADLTAAMGAGFYEDPKTHPTELYARTVQFSPNSTRQDWPDEVKPYYSGFLRGMGGLSSGGPTPPPLRDESVFGRPDANGNYGSVIPRWR
jgi:hypothetical protein